MNEDNGDLILVLDSQPKSYLTGSLVNITEIPEQPQWCLYPIFMTDQRGKKRVWQIGFDPNTNELVSKHGCVDGNLQESRVEVVPMRKNTMQQQALQEALNKRLQKSRKGYRQEGFTNSTKIPAQEANRYFVPGTAQKKSGWTSNMTFPAAVQPKLDGLRMRCWLGTDADGNVRTELYTRQNKEYIGFNELRNELAVFLSYFPAGVGLDGEFYDHQGEFNDLSGICRDENANDPRKEKIIYYIFDLIILEVPTENRVEMMTKAYQDYVKDGNQIDHFSFLPTYWANSPEEIVQLRDDFIRDGYEGAMIRTTAKSNPKNIKDTYYLGKRNNSLLKFKTFIEEEVTVIGVEEGKGKHKGCAVFRVRDTENREFSVNPSSEVVQRKEWFQHPEKCIGRIYTIKFQERNKNGIPRFATGKAFRDDQQAPGIKVY